MRVKDLVAVLVVAILAVHAEKQMENDVDEDKLLHAEKLKGVKPQKQVRKTFGGEDESSMSPRIVGGSVAKPRYPWFASLRYDGDHFCGGALIAPDKVITAAHCVDDFLCDAVMFGQYQLGKKSRGQQSVKVKNIYFHPGYDAVNIRNDIAIVHLEEDVKKVNPVNLDFEGVYDDQVGLKVDIIGFGSTREGGGLSNKLQFASAPLFDQDECQKTYPGLLDSMICAGGNGKDSCQGDSGGPLFRTEDDGTVTQIGIVSFGLGCGREDVPGVYTRVSEFEDWVTNSEFFGPCKDGFIILNATETDQWTEFDDGWLTYPGYARRCWLIQAQPGERVQLEFDYYKTEPRFDNIKIYESVNGGGFQDATELLGELSGEKQMEDPREGQGTKDLEDVSVFQSSDSALFVVFSSDASINNDGFKARYKVHTEYTLKPTPRPTPFPTYANKFCPDGVTQLVVPRNGDWLNFDDGYYPDDYPMDLQRRCYLAESPKGNQHGLELELLTINTEHVYDIVRVFTSEGDLHPGKNYLMGEFSGSLLEPQVYVGESAYLITLSSDASVSQARAFSARIRTATAEPTPSPTMAPTFDVSTTRICHKKLKKKVCKQYGTRAVIAVPCSSLENPCTMNECKTHCATKSGCTGFNFIPDASRVEPVGHCELHSNQAPSIPKNGACYSIEIC